MLLPMSDDSLTNVLKLQLNEPWLNNFYRVTQNSSPAANPRASNAKLFAWHRCYKADC